MHPPDRGRAQENLTRRPVGTIESAFSRLPVGVKYPRPLWRFRERDGARRAGGDAHDWADGRLRGRRDGDRLVGPWLRFPRAQRPADEGPRRADHPRGAATRERPGLLGDADTGLPEPEASPGDVRGRAQMVFGP